MPIKHHFQSGRADNGDAGAIQPSHWAADHDLTGLLAAIDAVAPTPNVVFTLNGANEIVLVATASFAPVFSAQLTGVPTAPTPLKTLRGTQIANMEVVHTLIDDLIGGAPGALDTLQELATAINNDNSYAATVTAALGVRLRVDAAQGLTTGQKAQGVANLGLATVAVSGNYADLGGKPTLATVALSGAYADLTGKPTLAAVATTGAYSDLTGKPSICPDVIIEEQLPSGTVAGTFTSGAWQTRALNTLVRNNGALASLSSNQVTLPAGTYYLQWRAPALAVSRHKTKIRNVTDASDVALGTSEYAASGTPVSTSSSGSCVVVLPASKAIALQHQCQTTGLTDGLGEASSFGVEIYSRLEITRIA